MSPVSRGHGGRRRSVSSGRPSDRPPAPTVPFDPPDLSVRKAWALPAADGQYDGIELSYLDRDEEDERRYLIEAEHPSFFAALRDDREIIIGGEPISPRLHVAMHEVVTNQLWSDDPPEVWATAQRLTALGYERHVVLHMIASLVTADLWQAMQPDSGPVGADYVDRLGALPQGWPPPRDVTAH